MTEPASENDLPVVAFHPFRWGDPQQATHLPAAAK